IFGDVTLTVPVGVAPEAERRGALEARLRGWGRRWYDATLVYRSVVDEFNKTSEKAPETALKKSRQGLGQLRADLLGLQTEVQALRADGAKAGLSLQQDFADAEQRLQDLRDRSRGLEKHVGDLDAALAKLKDPKIKEWQALLQRAKVLEAELEFDE